VETFSILTDSAESTRAFGERIGARFAGGETVLLSGPLGAGKTTLAQGMALGLGVRGRVQSPSFVLERIHRGRLTLRHLDFYRLTPEEVEDAGFFSDQDESAVTLVEWAERAGEISGAAFRVSISFVPGWPDRRKMLVETGSPEWGDKIRDAVREQDARYPGR
jgi:tRNA threonylcarbamoyladenosine biosynthesis protein TsaE